MKTRLNYAAVGAAIVAMLLAGCTPSTTAESSPTSSSTATAPAPAADGIRDIDDGIAWARNLDSSVSAQELSTGINKIGDLVPDLDIWFARNNEIGASLIQLNALVLADPTNAASKLGALNVIVDDIEEAIAHGNNP